MKHTYVYRHGMTHIKWEWRLEVIRNRLPHCRMFLMCL